MTRKKIQIVEFRKQVVKHLCHTDEVPVAVQRPKRLKHKLAKKEGPVRAVRRTCQQCYKLNAATIGAKEAKNKSKKVVTYCETCPNNPWLCLDCFISTHC